MSNKLTAEEGKAKVMRIMELALEISSTNVKCKEDGTKRPAVFVEYSPHVSFLDIRIYQFGWTGGSESSNYCICTDGRVGYSYTSFDEVISILEELLDEVIKEKAPCMAATTQRASKI